MCSDFSSVYNHLNIKMVHTDEKEEWIIHYMHCIPHKKDDFIFSTALFTQVTTKLLLLCLYVSQDCLRGRLCKQHSWQYHYSTWFYGARLYITPSPNKTFPVWWRSNRNTLVFLLIIVSINLIATENILWIICPTKVPNIPGVINIFRAMHSRLIL